MSSGVQRGDTVTAHFPGRARAWWVAGHGGKRARSGSGMLLYKVGPGPACPVLGGAVRAVTTTPPMPARWGGGRRREFFSVS